ncbi:hypothetical protein C7C46_01990 [Streptomyces tateyamensis]|uniref:Uncharacterized protein n=1 Tax=Streptomyces tateyamensis TaxID=565073 RepID=A0A2V4NN24_9ACTN|nr:hypothetical protein C7C46_01990 [Streptomyces tateyamensis]
MMTFPTNRDAEGALLARIFGDMWPPRHRLTLGEAVGALLVALGVIGFALAVVWAPGRHPGGPVVALGSASLVLALLGAPWAPTPRRVREVWQCWRRR